jgi:hypothetical protein
MDTYLILFSTFATLFIASTCYTCYERYKEKKRYETYRKIAFTTAGICLSYVKYDANKFLDILFDLAEERGFPISQDIKAALTGIFFILLTKCGFSFTRQENIQKESIQQENIQRENTQQEIIRRKNTQSAQKNRKILRHRNTRQFPEHRINVDRQKEYVLTKNESELWEQFCNQKKQENYTKQSIPINSNLHSIKPADFKGSETLPSSPKFVNKKNSLYEISRCNDTQSIQAVEEQKNAVLTKTENSETLLSSPKSVYEKNYSYEIDIQSIQAFQEQKNAALTKTENSETLLSSPKSVDKKNYSYEIDIQSILTKTENPANEENLIDASKLPRIFQAKTNHLTYAPPTSSIYAKIPLKNG